MPTQSPSGHVATLPPYEKGWIHADNDPFIDVDGFGPIVSNNGITVVSGDLMTERLVSGYGTSWTSRDGISWKPSDFWATTVWNTPLG
ncbi:MAG TPA: hypothetical protein VIK00_03205, partial [Candidatus Limnocylindrales bacterium]